MKLAAIFCVWDDWDMLEYSVNNILPYIDGLIIVGSNYSNFGEYSKISDEFIEEVDLFEPNLKKTPAENETAKRNYGLEIARKAGYTHFIMMDADEFYNSDEFNVEKEKFKFNHTLNGMVCRIQTYFGSPELTIGDEGTLVPFIHKITPGLKHEFNRRYPFAWQNRAIRIDPTRQLNIYDGVEMSEITMHHYSWIRKDYAKKIRNSTARVNLEKSTVMQDLALAKEGGYCNFYRKHLRRAPNVFNIPDYGDLDKSIQSIQAADKEGEDHQ